MSFKYICFIYLHIYAVNFKILTMIYCTGCENRDMRHFKWHYWHFDVMRLEKQELPYWINCRYVNKKWLNFNFFSTIIINISLKFLDTFLFSYFYNIFEINFFKNFVLHFYLYAYFEYLSVTKKKYYRFDHKSNKSNVKTQKQK